MKRTRYYVHAEYVYNVFGAHKRYRITLLKESPKRDTTEVVDHWDYPMGVTGLESRLGRTRAERRIRKLLSTYQAELL